MRTFVPRIVSVIVVVAVVGCWACGGGSAPPVQASRDIATDAAAASSSVDASAPAVSDPPVTSATSSARKRARRGPPAPLAHDGTKPRNGRPLNPRDDLGRTVFVRADDHCFIEVAPKEKPPPDAPPTRASEVVDCPPAADDPAWDHCAAQIVLDESGTKCFCVTGAGNPRPMPNPTPCPASAKAK